VDVLGINLLYIHFIFIIIHFILSIIIQLHVLYYRVVLLPISPLKKLLFKPNDLFVQLNKSAGAFGRKTLAGFTPHFLLIRPFGTDHS